MDLLFVGDGDRDEKSVPRVVENAIGQSVQGSFTPWRAIRGHRTRGYDRKLLFAILKARDNGLDGVVATIDRDNDKKRSRLRSMEAARTEDRSKPDRPSLPVGVGEADPHLEAWLLDDKEAVKDALEIPATKAIPHATSKDPKAELDRLIEACDRDESHREVLGDIASRVDISRCMHAKETGFREFLEDIRTEFG